MVVAALSAHVSRGFFISRGGFEYNLVLGVAGLTLAFTGPGALSFDAWLGYAQGRALWGLTALVTASGSPARRLSWRSGTRRRSQRPHTNNAGRSSTDRSEPR